MSEPATEARMETPSADRLVIRIKLVPREPVEPPARPRLSKTALLMLLGVVAVVLGWMAFSTFRSEPTPPPAAIAPAPKPAPAVAVAKPVEPEAQSAPETLPSATNEVVPKASQSALATVRGTIRVVIRVSIDKQGTVVGTTADEPGPSRYFLRLATEAAKQWTFTPAKSEERRSRLIRFNFTRDGASARLLEPPHADR
jgi:TonB family protein